MTRKRHAHPQLQGHRANKRQAKSHAGILQCSQGADPRLSALSASGVSPARDKIPL